jgi:hypothetical protein
MPEELEAQPKPDNSRESIRGRACPECGGKIIPSKRAVFEDKANPDAVFPLWECERCGYAEVSKAAAPAKKPAHGAKKGEA